MAFAPTGARFRSIPGRWGVGGWHTAATLTTSLTGTNNDLVFTASSKSAAGNAFRVVYRVSGNDTAFRIDYASSVLTVTVATDSGGAATTRARDIRVALNAASGIPITAADAAGNDGTGVVTALASTALSGGRDWVIGTSRR